MTGLFLFLFHQPSFGQSKTYRSGAFWPEVQVEYVLKSTSFFFFRNQNRHNFDDAFNHARENGPLQYLERFQIRGGYEYVFRGHWGLGVSESYAIERTRRILFNEIYGRHIGSIGKFRFTQRAAYEHVVRWGAETFGRSRIRADVDRDINLGKIKLRPRIAYELFFNYDYKQSPADPDVEREVDRTRLRLELQYVVNQRLGIMPHFIKQSDYFLVEPAYDKVGNLIRAGGRHNQIRPIWGLDIRYTIFEGGTPFPRNR